jgi:hypothetical protein
MTDGTSIEVREEFDKGLFKPPAGVSETTMRDLPEWQEGAAGNDFMAQLAARGGGDA